MTEPNRDPRAVAFQLLAQILDRRRTLDEALAESKGFAALAARDRALVRRLLATLLRRLGQVDDLIETCLNRPLKRGHGGVRNLLRLGAVQLAFLGTPAHAAVSTTLNLATAPRLAGHKGLINALLRRIAREGAALIAKQDAARLNTPRWLWQSWTGAYGEAAARSIAEAHLSEAPLDLTLKEPADTDAWAERLEATLLPTGSLRLAPGRGEIAKLPGFEDGAWWVQDSAATLPVRLLGVGAGQWGAGRRVVDLCAAPGGKTAALAALNADVTAVEVSPARAARLEENLARLGLNAETVTADAIAWRPPAPVDRVLLDAPCSGTGTLRRHPDIAWLKGPGDIATLTALQDRLLAAAVDMTAPGGTLVYAVCSLQPEEGPQRIAALLESGAPVVRLPVAAGEVFGQAGWLSPEGDLRTLPCHLADLGGMDGFYACRLRHL